MNIVSYIRVSGRGQLNGDGPDRQRDSVIAFARANKLLHTGEFFEQGVSGTVEGLSRPAFSDMLEKIEGAQGTINAKIEAIVVERMDRLARDLMVQEMLLKECRERGIKVFAADVGLVDQATNDGDPTRKLIRQVLGAVAEFAKSELVLKLRKARIRVKATTGRCEGPKPHGFYQGENDIKSIVLDMARTSKPSEIAARLNVLGFKTRTKQDWCRQSVTRVVKRLTKGTK